MVKAYELIWISSHPKQDLDLTVNKKICAYEKNL